MDHAGGNMSNRLEITTRIGCKINCVNCPQDKIIKSYFQLYPDGPRELTFELFKKCIDKVPLRTRIDFSGFSEPFLNKETVKMINYANERGHAIALYTTLVGMTQKNWNDISHIPFDVFVVHLPDNEKNAQIPITKTYLKLLEKVVNSHHHKTFSVHGTINEKIRKYIPRNAIVNSNLENRAGNVENNNVLVQVFHNTPIICENVGRNFTENVLLPNGTITLCCQDYKLMHILGSLSLQSYPDILNSLEAQRIREGMSKNLNRDILCRKCIRAHCAL